VKTWPFHGKAFQMYHLCDAPAEPEPNNTKALARPSRATDVHARRRRRAPAFAPDVPCASAAGTSLKARAAFAGCTTRACSSGIASALFAPITRPWRGAVRLVSRSSEGSARPRF
jgi:hypothetical protein